MSLYFIEQIFDWKIMKVMEDEGGNHIWGFDIGKGSLGEAVLDGSEFKHVASLLLDADFGEIKTAAGLRRQMRTRKAHKAGKNGWKAAFPASGWRRSNGGKWGL